MTIYIYGSKSFKNSIHEVLDHANVKFKLEEDDAIVDVDSIIKLQEVIEDNPNNIFLIDDQKIIRKNSLNEKIKFLKPKDGISEEFLKEHGIGDMSVNSIEDIATHVKKRLDEVHDSKNDNIDDYETDNHLDRDETSSLNYEEDNEEQTLLDKSIDEMLRESEDSDESDVEHYNYDEDDFDIDDVVNYFDEDEDNELSLETLEPNKDNVKIEEDDFGLVVEEIEQKGENDMSDEFSELDSLNEDEMMAALNGMSEVSSETKPLKSDSSSSNEVELNSSSVNDLTSLITQLLNNKTLEITIKIKE